MINSLYVHIPFCAKKCLYCDFNSYTCLDYEEEYLKALNKELSFITQNSFKTIFVGGGTPTILSENNLKQLLTMLSRFKSEEYTFECNPGTISMNKLRLMKFYGVNRLSIGLQSTEDHMLKKLGRIHNYNDFLTGYNDARELGFNNINIDLMFGIPDQTREDFQNTINTVMTLDPEHISCYSLIVEEGTPFYELEQAGKLNLCDEDTERSMYYDAIKALKQNGYDHYEISNFAIPNHECRHNLTYWQEQEYYGVGAGAHSFINKLRYSNYPDIATYINKINTLGSAIENSEKITIEDEISEYMFLGLRLLKGISKSDFFNRFGIDIYNTFNKELNTLINEKLLVDNTGYIYLTPRGIDISNQVFINFLK